MERELKLATMSPVPQHLFPDKQNLLKPFGTSRFLDENAIYFSKVLNYINCFFSNYLTSQTGFSCYGKIIGSRPGSFLNFVWNSFGFKAHTVEVRVGKKS